MTNLKKLLKLLKGNFAALSVSAVSVFIYTLSAMAIPLVIKFTIDYIIGDSSEQGSAILEHLTGRSLLKAGLIILLLSISRGIFLYIKGFATNYYAEKTAKKLKDDMIEKLQNTNFSYYSSHDTGDLIQRTISDVETIRKLLANQVVEIFAIILMITIILFMMISMNVKLTLIALSLVPFIMGMSMWFFQNVKKKFKVTDESEAKLTSVIQENLSGVKIVKAFSKEKYENEKFETYNEDFREKVYRLILNFAYFWSISDFLAFTQMGLVLVFGSMMAVEGKTTIGTLVAFTTYEGMLMMPIRQLGRVLSELGKTLVSVSRVSEVLSIPQEQDSDGTTSPEIHGVVEFKNVSFSYEHGHEILKDISFKVDKGSTIGILGTTGSGKSTLMYLLTRLYEPVSGEILIDGKDIRQMKKKHIRQNVGLILQDSFLFTKTIRENVTIKDLKTPHDEMVETTRISHIHESILQFEKEYDTLVGEKGVSLSGGQRQRIAISRMLLKRMPILIFDDSLSAVDARTDRAIRKSLGTKMNKSTTFIISHRVSTLSETDKILVMDKGRIIHFDTHENLINIEGIYKDIWELQSKM